MYIPSMLKSTGNIMAYSKGRCIICILKIVASFADCFGVGLDSILLAGAMLAEEEQRTL